MIKIKIIDKIAIISIDRPKHLNAINIDVIKELSSVFEKYEKSHNVRSLILTGTGDKAFIAGADIKAMSKMSASEAYEFSKLGNDLTLLMENYSKPIICAVNGYALGGGCEISMACHIRIASDNALFGQPESGLGLIPGFGGTQRLPRIVGLSNAYEILLAGISISAEKAKNIGLISEVFKADSLLDNAIKIAKKINLKSPYSSNLIIQLVNEGISLNIEDALNLESKYFEKVFNHENKDIGISSFIERKNPDFKD